MNPSDTMEDPPSLQHREMTTDAVFPELVVLIAEIEQACADAGRADLAGQLALRRARVAEPDVAVVVAGDYKAGKSSLVNALVGADICPVDEDVATAVPTLVRYAPEPVVLVRREPDGDEGAPEPEPVPVDSLASYASERANPGNRERLRNVEVGIPAPILRDGLVLVDTPGVGGLVSAQTVATLASLSMAQAALFVSDATQEYTGPELEFLSAARQVCPAVLPVLTKVDLAPAWTKIRELDQGWLERGGLIADIIPVSSALSFHGRARRRTDLEGESGLAPLIARLHQVLHEGRLLVAADAVAEIHNVVGQLAAPVTAERDALWNPSPVIADLELAEDRGRRLASESAEWQMLLDDGLSDLEDEVVVEVTNRMRIVQRESERTIMKTDPAAKWDEFEAELGRQVSTVMAAIASMLLEGAQQVAETIAEHFADHEALIAPTLHERDPALSAASILAEASAGSGAGSAAKVQWRGVLLEAGWSGLEGLAAIGSILTFTSISLFNPFALAIGVFIGGKSLHQARSREVQRRREQAVEAVTRYLDDATRATDREWRASLRRLRRELRRSYQDRADALHRSARESLAAAQRTLVADAAGRQARLDELASGLARLHALDGRADELATELTAGAAGTVE
ncbi:MAG: hypothetical protein QOJ52_613 [Acidimicrobiaceae bacterium]|nr:hypothetical protein [Acidimicrobiaceae bacterium]MDQ1441817.1 hypothetical protein [Acidimicrobiaceae bacterium]